MCRLQSAVHRAAMRDDVAIVGAGPAGARAAYVLATRGARVTIVRPVASAREAVRRRRHRPRAGAGGRRHRRRPTAPRRVIRSARFTDSPRAPIGRGGARGPRRPSAVSALVVADRATFDAALLAAARARRRRARRSRVTEVTVDAGGVDARDDRRRPPRARSSIGADGANSLVRRRVATPFRRDQLSIATGFFAHGVTSDEIVIELTSDPPGYIWSFPRPTHLAIGICAQADAGVTAGRAARAARARGLRRRGSRTARGSNRTRGRFRR